VSLKIIHVIDILAIF